MCEYVEKMSNGRIVMTPTAPGAVCPVEEQLDAVASGATGAMDCFPGYYSGKIPIEFAHADCVCAPKTFAEMRYLYEYYQGGRIMELFQEEYTKYGDIHLVGHHYMIFDTIISSNVPIYGVDDLDGVAFRSSEMIAEALAKLGAGTVWCPGPEIYTMLATGVVDAVTFCSTVDNIGLGFHEVTKYWVKKPVMAGPGLLTFIVNEKVWQELPDDLKAILEAAVQAASWRTCATLEIEIAKGWKFVEDYGIEIIEWPDEDCAIYAEALRSLLDKYREDPACAEMFDILEDFMIEMGYWKA